MTGCIAQVFKGILKGIDSAKTAVAIKLIHPHVEALVKIDMEILGFMADVMDKFPSLEVLSLGDTCRQFADMMQDQLDLRKEVNMFIYYLHSLVLANFKYWMADFVAFCQSLGF